MRPDPPLDDVDSEWVDVEEDHDDEITFRANANPDEVVPNDQLDDTLPYVPSPGQQVEAFNFHVKYIKFTENPVLFPVKQYSARLCTMVHMGPLYLSQYS